MRKKFRISLIIPKGYIHSQAFFEIALLLKSAIDSNGFESDIKVNELAGDSLNIILGYHLLTVNDYLRRHLYIPFQFEQLKKIKTDLNSIKGYFENLVGILKNAKDVWDYSEENICFLGTLGIQAKYLNPGFHPNLEIISHDEKDIDILFYGTMDNRRREL